MTAQPAYQPSRDLLNGAPPKVTCRSIWKVFGPHPERTVDLLRQNSPAGRSKEELLAETGHVVAVRDISFDVRPGETFVVMGLSGSGKSTLLRCIPRLVEPTSGSVLIDGQDITAADPRRLRGLRRHKMSMVFQHFGLFPHRRIIDNVAYGLEVQGVKRSVRHERARHVLSLVNLTGWEEHYPGQLSGGMQQRVGLARALAVDPEILLFDEPFSALDPLIRREMQDELISLQRRVHKTSIFITHDFAEAIKLGDRIAIMKDGAFVQVGASDEIILRPANDYVAEFTRDVPRSKVLTARTIMGPPLPTAPDCDPVPCATTVEELIPRLAHADIALPIVDEQGALVGSIDRAALLAALERTDPPVPPARSS